MRQDNVATINRKRIKLAIISIASLLALVLGIALYVHNALVIVTIDNKAGGSSTVSAVGKDATTKVGSGGLLLVPRDTKVLLVESGDSSAIAQVAIPWLGIASVDVRVEAKQTAAAVAKLGQELPCVTATDQTLMSYDCDRPTELLRQALADDKSVSERVAELSYISDQVLPPYHGGVIGLAEATSTGESDAPGRTVAIVAINQDDKTVYDAPDGMTVNDLTGVRLFTDYNNPDNTRFILVDGFGMVYLGVPSDDGKKIDYHYIDAPADYSYLYNHTLCAIEGDDAYCYRGRTQVKLAEDATYEKTPTISKLSFADGSAQTVKTSATYLNKLYLTASGSLYGKFGSTLVALEKHDDTYAARDVMYRVDTALDGDRLYFTVGKRLYAFDDASHSAQQLAPAADTVIKAVYPVAGQVFFFAGSDSLTAYHTGGTATESK